MSQHPSGVFCHNKSYKIKLNKKVKRSRVKKGTPNQEKERRKKINVFGRKRKIQLR